MNTLEKLHGIFAKYKILNGTYKLSENVLEIQHPNCNIIIQLEKISDILLIGKDHEDDNALVYLELVDIFLSIGIDLEDK